MNISGYTRFDRLLTNKHVLKGLEKVSEHGASFVAATSLAMAVAVRPVVIAHTPHVKKENKQYSATNSITSGLIKFALVEAIAMPVENAVKNIERTPQRYLKHETINNLKAGAKQLSDSQNFRFANQLLKLGTGFLTAIPKSMLTIALIPMVMDLLFPNKENKEKNNNFQTSNVNPNSKSTVFNNFNQITSNDKNRSFNGKLSYEITKGVSKVINNNSFQNYIKTHNNNSTNIARNISMATDVLLTSSFVAKTLKSKKIKEENKKPLIYNNIISTAISLTSGFTLDKLVQKGSKGFIDKFTELNKNNPKLPKYIEGLNIIRPTIIFAAIYYGILPLFSTYLAERTDEFITKKQENNNINK